MQKITPFLWFDTQAEEAIAFYLSVFKDGKIITTTTPENGPRPAGMVNDDRLRAAGGAVRGAQWRAEVRIQSRAGHNECDETVGFQIGN
jgi:predicted 3-demethylubiquinone-9 3-methyltransferase (glyoxalase superfamily)